MYMYDPLLYTLNCVMHCTYRNKNQVQVIYEDMCNSQHMPDERCRLLYTYMYMDMCMCVRHCTLHTFTLYVNIVHKLTFCVVDLVYYITLYMYT